jgi:hypothetical protein
VFRRKPVRIATIAMLFAVGCLSIAAAQDPFNGWKVVQRTDALSLTGVDNSTGFTVFSLRNTTAKTISAFAVSLGDNRNPENHYIDYFGSASGGLAPGGVHQLKLAPPANAARALRIAAVVFADGTSGGLQSYVDFVAFKRLGRILETERVERILASSTGGGALNDIRSRLGELPGSVDEALASMDDGLTARLPGVFLAEIRQADQHALEGFLTGVRNSREDALRTVAGLGERPAASALQQLRKTYDEKSQEGRALCEKIRRHIQ